MKRLTLILLVSVVAFGLTFAGLFDFFTGGKKKEEKAAEAQQAEEEKAISVFGSVRGDEGLMLRKCFEPFEEKTGIEVNYEGSADFETQIKIQVQSGATPDIATIPQPGMVYDFAAAGEIKPLPSDVEAAVDANYTKSWKDLGSYDGKLYGVFHRVNAKSFVWYSKKIFEKEGYQEPKTWEEMKTLMDQMVEDGYTPWSIGFESGNATGWAGTDWMEDIMLRTAGPDMYDKWISHEIPFNHPAVLNAVEIFLEIAMTDKYTLGGPNNILATSYGDAVLPLYEKEPKALMHRQANFIINFMQEDVQNNLEEEVGVFALPQIDPKWGTPVLGGGEMYVAFRTDQTVYDFMKFLTTWEACETWAESGGAIFPHQNQDFSVYAKDIEAKLAKILTEAEIFRFDGSDMMPAKVGAGTFWTGMVDIVSGQDPEKVLKRIDDSWPK